MSYESVIKLDEFTVFSGNDFYLTFDVLDKTGIPYDLTDCTTSMKIAEYGNIRVVKSEINGTVDEENNSVSFVLTGLTTKRWSGKYVYQLKITKPDTKKVIPKQGCFMVVPRITIITENTLSLWEDETLEDIKDMSLYNLSYTES